MTKQETKAAAEPPLDCRVRPRGLDSVLLTDSDRVRDGLAAGLYAAKVTELRGKMIK